MGEGKPLITSLMIADVANDQSVATASVFLSLVTGQSFKQ
jgi:hypothetical protein